MKTPSAMPAEAIATAIRERIQTLHEELEHWEEMLKTCDAHEKPNGRSGDRESVQPLLQHCKRPTAR